MANQAVVESLTKVIDQALGMYGKNLLARQDWGVINFNAASLDLDRAKAIFAYLKVLPLESLPDNSVSQIQQAGAQVIPILGQIDQFTIASGNPSGTRDNIVTTLHQQVDNFYSVSANWIPFLAYQKGDVADNISKLTNAVNEARALMDDAKSGIDIKNQEIEKIIIAAREASASAGAAVFTKDFEVEASSQEGSAKNWLIATGAGLILTMVVASGMWWHAESAAALTNSQVVQAVAAKLVILSMMITGSVWCGRQYKALKHLSTLNRHRALSLRTLKAFSAAASDEQTKNAVLLEVTRAVFQSNQTGYLDGAGGDDSPMKIIEIAKVLGGKSS